MSRTRPENTKFTEATEYTKELEKALTRLPPQLEELSFSVIGAAMDVHSALGPGFQERIYEAALLIELGRRRIRVRQQVEIPIHYDDQLIATARLDLLVADSLVLELKAVPEILPLHKAQLLAYLKAADLELGLLINFNVRSLKAGVSRVLRTSSLP